MYIALERRINERKKREAKPHITFRTRCNIKHRTFSSVVDNIYCERFKRKSNENIINFLVNHPSIATQEPQFFLNFPHSIKKQWVIISWIIYIINIRLHLYGSYYSVLSIDQSVFGRKKKKTNIIANFLEHLRLVFPFYKCVINIINHQFERQTHLKIFIYISSELININRSKKISW